MTGGRVRPATTAGGLASPRIPPDSPAIRVELLTTVQELELLRTEWSPLVDRSSGSTVFVTWEWVRSWWRHFGGHRELFVLTARSTDGTLVGVAPWMRVRRGIWPLGIRVLSFIGTGVAFPVHLDVLAEDGRGTGVATAMLAFLESREMRAHWDCLDARSIVGSSAFEGLVRTRPDRFFEQEEVRTAFVPLSHVVDFETDALSGKVRRELRRCRRTLERDHGDFVAMRRVEEPGAVEASLDALIALHQKRWSSLGFSTSLSDADFTSFLRDFSMTALDRGWLRLWRLEVGEQTIAVNHCFCIKDVVYGYQKAFDPEWSAYAPGHLVQLEAFLDSAADGMRELDMLVGGGADPRWPTENRNDVSFVYAHTWRGRLFAVVMGAFSRFRTVLGRRLPRGVKRRLERLLPG